MKRTSFVPGEVCWVDCGTDVRKATDFYGGLLGWTVADMGPDAGGYGIASKDGSEVAGLGPQQAPGAPYWSVYFRVDDVDKTAELVTSNGGTVVMGAMDVMEAGRMAVFLDPVGAAFSVWQPGQHLGFGIVDEPGAFSWAELTTTDTATSARFYAAVFGFTARESTDPDMAYTEFLLDELHVGGMMQKPAEMPAEVPPFWGLYFNVADADATIAKVPTLGGQLVWGPTDVPSVGRIAQFVDAAGATFSILEPATT